MTIGNKHSESSLFTGCTYSHPNCKYEPGNRNSCCKMDDLSWSGRDGKKSDNPFLKTRVWSRNPQIHWRRKNQAWNIQGGSLSNVHGAGLLSVVSTDPWTSNDTIALLNKLGEKTNQSSFDAGTFLAEGKPALDGITGAASSLASAIRAVKRGDMKGAAKALSVNARNMKNRGPSRTADETTGRWLELNYGWLPLIGDLDSAARACAAAVEKPLNKTFRVGRTARIQGSSNTTSLKVDYRNTHRRSLKVTLSKPPNPFQLSLVSPAKVAWELVPYSFVVDWALPIGDYLNAQHTRATLPVAKVVTSDKIRRIREVVGYTGNPINGGYVNVSGDPMGITYETFRFERSISTQLPSVPMPGLKPLGDILSWRRAASALSLMYQAFK